DKVGKYGLLGLMLFVAIPLPITGAWTGTIGAWVMGLDRKKSILFIILGVLVAGIVVSAVVATGAGIASLFTKQVNI
ncbi:MAG: small multi-drug export protein, partial [Spirochaetales bacterium]|nr:small multi-drug export protein [Spirochaetales bacterium]